MSMHACMAINLTYCKICKLVGKTKNALTKIVYNYSNCMMILSTFLFFSCPCMMWNK